MADPFAPVLKVLRQVPKNETGTTVWFKSDAQIFTVLEYNYDTLASRLRELSFLNKGTTINWVWLDDLNSHDVKLSKGPSGVKKFHSDSAAAQFTFKQKLTKLMFEGPADEGGGRFEAGDRFVVAAEARQELRVPAMRHREARVQVDAAQ